MSEDLRIVINDVLGVNSATVELVAGDAVEVIGSNASGKTSLATAAQAVLAGNVNPLGLPASDVKHYVRDGAEPVEAMAALWAGNDVLATWWPSSQKLMCSQRWEGCDPIAVGLVDLTAKRSAREQAALFQRVLLPPPSEVVDAVRAALSAYLSDSELGNVMGMLTDGGDVDASAEAWSDTEKVFRGRALESKRLWCAVTGLSRYGVKVAADWHPDMWLAEFDHLTPQQAEELVVAARDELMVLHRVSAVSEAEQERAQVAEARLPELVEAHGLVRVEVEQQAEVVAAARAAAETAAQNVRVLRGRVRDLEAALAGLTEEPLRCPHCDNPVSFDATYRRVEAASVPDESLVGDATARLATAKTELVEAETAARQTQAKVADESAKLTPLQRTERERGYELRRAQETANVSGVVRSEADIAAVAAAEQLVEDRKQVASMIKAYSEAAKLHETIVTYTAIADAVGPQGVRTKLLEDGLATLNRGLRLLATETRWPLVEVTHRGYVYWDNRPLRMCSESEKWRTQVCVQLVVAAITKSRVVVVDRADVLDSDNREGLIAAIRRVALRTGLAVLVCATDQKTDEVWTRSRISCGVVGAVSDPATMF